MERKLLLGTGIWRIFMDAIVSIISSIFGIIGTLLSVYFGRETRKIKTKLNRFYWSDIETGVDALVKRISKEYDPEIVLCSSNGASGIIANLYLVKNDNYIPIIYGNQKKTGTEFPVSIEENSKYCFKTSKWEVYLSNDLEKYKDKRLLVIEDVVISGDTLEEELKVLKECGYSSKNIRTAALFVSGVALKSNKNPDFYWFELDDLTLYYYPWGRTIVGKGFDQ